MAAEIEHEQLHVGLVIVEGYNFGIDLDPLSLDVSYDDTGL